MFRHVLVILTAFCLMGCQKQPGDVLAPSPAMYAQAITPIPSIPVAEQELDLVTKLDSQRDTLKVTTEIGGAYYPPGTVYDKQHWLDVNMTKYLIILIYDEPCYAYGPFPAGHDYDRDCFNPDAWAAPKKMGLGDPTDTNPTKRFFVVRDPDIGDLSGPITPKVADGDGSVVKTATFVGDPTADDAPRR